MDGYASDGAALILDGMKVTLKTAPPKVIICDTDILKNAPIELIRAGVGDILGKYSCLNDWLLAAYVKGEYFCQRIYNEVMEATHKVAENLEKILARDGENKPAYPRSYSGRDKYELCRLSLPSPAELSSGSKNFLSR